MKDFLSKEKFRELRVLFIVEAIMALLLTVLISVNDFNINYLDWRPFAVSIGMWLISSILDKEKYFNLATLISTGLFMYAITWFAFNVFIKTM